MTAGGASPAREPMAKDRDIVAGLYLDILRDCGYALPPALRILDFGCGNGSTTKAFLDMGIDAQGCDFRFKEGLDAERLAAEDRLRLIAPSPYRLPFVNGSFDIAVSNQVFEHVRNYPETLAELRRVLKPGGLSVHLFPARWKPIESHVFVPFASVVRNEPWLMLWAMAGVRRASQAGKSAGEIARANKTYLDGSTNYLGQRDILDHFRRHFGEVRFAERAFLKHSPHRRGRQLHAAGVRAPILFAIYRAFWARVLVAAR